ncbi:4-hydroxy-4-methyl-2-oxoglutarate aldolase [Cocleimonas flava]|uniref:Putative 4-hydroxy-4-methyl-2-oxoglutarate aldolase n=2 Tax=Cocleimonas flava TaxID=634765 RepID=A0A4R1EVQ5_9GAMM|nr:4-hydroxy-4-methyl-2-oxoglutarate aldolase [Cocleimonas flava]
MTIPKLPNEQYQKAIELGSATICEAQGSRGVMANEIRPVHPSMKMAGPAVTLDMKPGDNLMLHYALLKTNPGDILVVDAKGFLEAGIWGDILTEQALFKQLGGILVNGAVRDTDQIIEMDFPVFTKGICIKGTTKIQSGELNVPLTFSNVRINPGDIVVADSDGIVIIEKEDFDEVLANAIAREEKEMKFRESIKKGGVTANLLNLEKTLEDNNFILD